MIRPQLVSGIDGPPTVSPNARPASPFLEAGNRNENPMAKITTAIITISPVFLKEEI